MTSNPQHNTGIHRLRYRHMHDALVSRSGRKWTSSPTKPCAAMRWKRSRATGARALALGLRPQDVERLICRARREANGPLRAPSSSTPTSTSPHGTSATNRSLRGCCSPLPRRMTSTTDRASLFCHHGPAPSPTASPDRPNSKSLDFRIVRCERNVFEIALCRKQPVERVTVCLWP